MQFTLPFYTVIILWWVSVLLFANAFLNISPLKNNNKNFILWYSLLIAITGIWADCIVVANKPIMDKNNILKKFPQEWNTSTPVLDFLNLGKMCQSSWELYSLGNKNYQNAHNWTWNYELPHVMGNSIYMLAIVFMFLKNKNAFIVSLLFGSLILTIDYTVYIIHVCYELYLNKHSETKIKNMLISWLSLDIPYMFFAGYVILWYAYTSLNEPSVF